MTRAARLALVALAMGLAVGCSRGAPPVPRRPIGSPCAADADCGSAPAFYCATDHPGGYCEAWCRRDRDCPAGAVCVGAGYLSKGGCHTACAAASGCRADAGYQCIAAGQDASRAYCDPPGRSGLQRRLRDRAWRW